MIIGATQRWSYINAIVEAPPELPVGDESKRDPNHNPQLAEQALQGAKSQEPKVPTAEEIKTERAYHYKRLGIKDLSL